jgi:hypothetical protein
MNIPELELFNTTNLNEFELNLKQLPESDPDVTITIYTVRKNDPVIAYKDSFNLNDPLISKITLDKKTIKKNNETFLAKWSELTQEEKVAHYFDIVKDYQELFGPDIDSVSKILVTSVKNNIVSTINDNIIAQCIIKLNTSKLLLIINKDNINEPIHPVIGLRPIMLCNYLIGNTYGTPKSTLYEDLRQILLMCGADETLTDSYGFNSDDYYYFNDYF